MEKLKAVIKNAWGYQQDKMNLPVVSVELAIPFYESKMGFRLISTADTPARSAVLERDGIQIGLSENGGDPEQDGCFFEVDNIETALQELKLNGLDKEISAIQSQQQDDTKWKVFFVVAPDGLCYCFGEKIA